MNCEFVPQSYICGKNENTPQLHTEVDIITVYIISITYGGLYENNENRNYKLQVDKRTG